MSQCSRSIGLVLLLSLMACETPRMGAPHDSVGSMLKSQDTACGPMTPELCDLARTNRDTRSWYKEHEWQFNRNNPKKRPLVCVAFSGGGIRSAAFSIGVMKGLWESKDSAGHRLFDRVDILSGTSGGAYAVSWYFMQRLHNNTDDDLFKSGSAAQQALKDHADFVGIFNYATAGLINVGLMAPVNFLLNGVLGIHANTNFFGNVMYRNEIEKTFYSNKSNRLLDLRRLLTDHHARKDMPYFVITTTSRVDENSFHNESLLRNTVFEFTPFRVGNDGFGYVDPGDKDMDDLNLDVARLATISGAALDTSQVVTGTSQRFLASTVNADLGQYISNYNDHRHAFRKLWTKALPFPFYFFTESYNHDMRGSDIYLSDGGHQENLAAYPLIRRQCQNILIVDAEYDQHYAFESYFKLKHNVEHEMQVNMSLERRGVCTGQDGCTDVEQIEKLQHRAQESGLTRAEAETKRAHVSQNSFSGHYPALIGHIRYFPVFNENNPPDSTTGTADELGPISWQETTLIYLKMSVDTPVFAGWDKGDAEKKRIRTQVGEQAANYYAAAKDNKCAVKYLWNNCAFPQFSTSQQSFTPEQFEAYVDLAATMVGRNLTMEGDVIKLNDTPQ